MLVAVQQGWLTTPFGPGIVQYSGGRCSGLLPPWRLTKKPCVCGIPGRAQASARPGDERCGRGRGGGRLPGAGGRRAGAAGRARLSAFLPGALLIFSK